MAGRRLVSLRHQLPQGRPLGGGSRAVATLTVAVVAAIGWSSALAASTTRPPAELLFSVPSSSGSLSTATDQHLTLRLATPATAAQPPVWHACPYPGVPAALQCATLTVPIDYTHPARGSTHVVIDRLPAADPAHRLGSLVFDPVAPAARAPNWSPVRPSAAPSSPGAFATTMT